MADETRANPLVIAAARISRSSAVLTGYLKKKKSAGDSDAAGVKWQKRFFLLLPGANGISYFCYYKTAAADAVMLAAMDLSRAGPPELINDGADSVFAIQWDRFREFQASSRAEAVAWVNAIAAAQSNARKAGIPSPNLYQSGSAGKGTPGAVGDWSAKQPRATESSRLSKRELRRGGGEGGSCCVVA